MNLVCAVKEWILDGKPDDEIKSLTTVISDGIAKETSVINYSMAGPKPSNPYRRRRYGR